MKNLKLILYFLFFLFISSTYAAIDQEKKLAETIVNKNTFAEYLLLAEKGDANAQNKIAISYLQGNGVIKDLDRAFYWFEKAANQNHPEAQFYYATLILNVESQKCPEEVLYKGPPVSIICGHKAGAAAESILWFKKAAQHGYVKAQSSLGIMYMIGLGTKIDFPESFKWNKKAAEAGNVEAMYNLAQLYEKGKGVEQSSNKAVFWYEQSAKQGFTLSEFELGVAHALGIGGYEKNENEAIEWYEKAAKKGNMYAQSNLAGIYFSKSYQDYKYRYQSVFWRKKAAEQGLPESQMLLGLAYLNGEGIERDKLLGLEWLYKSSQSGHDPAKKILQELNLKQENDLVAFKTKYQEEAKTWTPKAILELETSAKNSDALAQEHLAIAYQFGLLGAPKNLQLAAEWYIKRIGSNLSDTSNTSQKNLSLIYIEGLNQSQLHLENETVKVKSSIDGLAANGNLAAIKFLARFYFRYSNGYYSLKQAKFWYAKAANMGDSGAQLALARLYMSISPNEAGIDAQPDYTKALYWYKKVVVYDKPYAQYELAKLYIDGRGGEKNPAEAMVFLRKAADKNIFNAQMDLAKAYKVGVITKQDYPKALELFKKLATSTYSGDGNRYEAFYNTAMSVAEIYENGLGVPLDKVQAFIWYSLVSEYSQRKIFYMPDPNNLPKGVSIGALLLEFDYNLEEDTPSGLFGGTTDSSLLDRNEKVKVKLSDLEKNMTVAEINAAKKALNDWKDKHQNKTINSI